MAIDEQMLANAYQDATAYLRFYGWAENAFTFGYSQSWESINQEANIPTTEIPLKNRIRRITGGGLVDHRHGITYALAIPRNHAAATGNATHFYQQLHQALQNTLGAFQLKTELQSCPCETADSAPHRIHAQCFKQAEPYDLINPQSHQKIAGAALRRNRSGLLVQGSLSKNHLPEIDLDSFAQHFQKQLVETFDLRCTSQPFRPSLSPSDGQRQRYASSKWNTKR